MAYRKTPSRIEHAERVKESIIDAALTIVRANGLEGLTVRRVVSTANSSIGNYYHHFENKQALLLALIDRLADHVAGEVDRVAATIDHVPTRLHRMVSVGLAAALREPALPKVLFAAGYGEEVRAHIRRRFIERTVGFFGRHPVGVAEKLDAHVVAVLWQGAVLMLVEQMAAGALDLSVEDAARVCADWNLRALGLENAADDEA